MRTNLSVKYSWVRWVILVAIIAFLLILANYKLYGPPGFITGAYLASVSIISQSECIIYEDDNTGYMDDFVFQIGPMAPDGNWYSYNGSYGGIHAGYDTGAGSDNITQTFAIKNMGTITVDVTMASSDFDNDLKNDSKYIDVAQANGSFQIYLPGAGWKNVPDNSDEDEDGIKETSELCIANDLMINDTIKGIDFQIRSSADLGHENYTVRITVTSYDSAKINPCSDAGIYTIP